MEVNDPETENLLFETKQQQTKADNTDNSKKKATTAVSLGCCGTSQVMGISVTVNNETDSTAMDNTDTNETVVANTEPDEECQAEVVIADDTISTSSVIQGDMCRICHCYAEESETLISPCGCNGSMKYVHQACLQKWVKSRDTKKCELCGYSYNMTSSVKPFRQWKKLDMSSVERRKVLCSVTFHVVAITCVIWSLYVLIDRTTTEIKQGNLNWPFWTKLVVVAIGFTGGLVFMYVQCKMYVQLFKKWKQFNRVIYINDVQVGEHTETNKSNDEIAQETDSPQTHDAIIVIQMPPSGDTTTTNSSGL